MVEAKSDVCVGRLSVTYSHSVGFLDTVGSMSPSSAYRFISSSSSLIMVILCCWTKTSRDALDSFSVLRSLKQSVAATHASQTLKLNWANETRNGTNNYFHDRFLKAQGDVLKGLFLSSKTQKNSVYCHERLRKLENIHINF